MSHPTTKVPRKDAQNFHVVGAGMTHKGLVREANEDMILTDPAGSLWAVADGMGGHGNGAFASDLVIDSLTSLPAEGSSADRLEIALQSANQALINKQKKQSSGVAGATVVAALFERDRVDIVWAGDSRAYRLRNEVLQQLTRDHSVVQDLIDAGRVQTTEMENHPEAHIVTRAVGGSPDLTLDRCVEELKDGDCFLLCSDGLSRCVNDAQLRELLTQPEDPENVVRSLLQAAMEAGAPDNVSAIVVAVKCA